MGRVTSTTTTRMRGSPGRTISPMTFARQSFYQPVARGFEREISKRLEYWEQASRPNVSPGNRNRERHTDIGAGSVCVVNMIVAIAIGGAAGAVGRHFVNVGMVATSGARVPVGYARREYRRVFDHGRYWPMSWLHPGQFLRKCVR